MGTDGILRVRTAVLGLSRAAFLSLGLAFAHPLQPIRSYESPGDEPEAEDAALWVLYVISMALVLLGGAFAGLTIALMGQDEIYLQVISLDPEEPQRRNAKRVFDLLNKGKHWVLVTLLLSNVIVNETLPVVLDRCFGGGVAAVVGSTVLIVIFGEILPQSVCVRYGLQIGGYMSKPVVLLMYLMAPVAWPTAKLLDWLLGEDHGTIYKKSGLKTLVTLHKSLGEVDERLNQDEVTIISAVLDLKRKAVEEVMTPMDDVYVMSEDTVLDEKTVDQILDAGYSRIPIYQTGNPTNFVGMLLVRILITYDPEDCKRVKDFALAALPETRPETSCLDIINFFQEGKSHMVLISESPGEDHGALGVVTLEDVIEELIGEEIIDESDVYVDVHKAIRRSHPAPKARALRKDMMIRDAEIRDGTLIDIGEESGKIPQPGRTPSFSSRTEASALGSSPKMTTFLVRRRSAGQDGQLIHTTIPIKANIEEIRDHFKHLGPSNPASNPKSTRVSAVKIKPAPASSTSTQQRSGSITTDTIVDSAEGAVNERTSLLRPQLNAKDGAQALHQSYTNTSTASPNASPKILTSLKDGTSEHADRGTQTRISAVDKGNISPTQSSTTDSIESVHDASGRRRGHVRSGSITENIIESGGIRKVILEANSSSSEDEGEEHSSSAAAPSSREGPSSPAHPKGHKKKNRRKHRSGGK
ncbi:cell agglutination protein Mam3 [Parahypoxylon ruwenzoriense]